MERAVLAEHAYRYLGVSTLAGAGRLALATSGGRSQHPYIFRGFVEQADQAARALLAVAEVARTRYFDPGAAARSRDPVVTSNRSVLRFESFSGCNGVYVRLDLDAAGFDAEHLDWGTTNVDVNEPLRAALAGVGAGDPLRLTVGPDELAATTLDADVVERKVPLPDRWLKGFAEVQIASAGMVEVARLGPAPARAVLRDLPASRAGNRPFWVVFTRAGARLSQRPAGGAPSLVGPQRLAALRRVLPHVRGLTVYAAPPRGRLRPGGQRDGDGDVLGASAWVVHLDGAAVTLVISPEIFRGFSGEGAVLEALATAERSTVERVADMLAGQARLDLDVVASATGGSRPATIDALRVLSAAGRLGYDLRGAGFFHRDLPFDRSALEAVQPRLRDAVALVDAGAVTQRGEVVAVGSGDAEYRVRIHPEGATCTCPWFAKHRGERGPCKHVLAAQLVRLRAGTRVVS